MVCGACGPGRSGAAGAGHSDGVSGGLVTSRQARATSTGAPSDVISPSRISVRPPERTVRTWISRSATGTGRRSSTVTRAMRIPGRGACCSMARPMSAEGGPPCWVLALQGPAVAAVLAKRPSPRSW